MLPEGGTRCCSSLPPPAAEGARKAKQFVALHWKGASERDLGDNGTSHAQPGDFHRFLAEAGTGQRFTISGMAFQDALSLDLERVRGCCIHVVRPDGRLIPFCLHNLTARDGTRLYGAPWA